MPSPDIPFIEVFVFYLDQFFSIIFLDLLLVFFIDYRPASLSKEILGTSLHFVSAISVTILRP